MREQEGEEEGGGHPVLQSPGSLLPPGAAPDPLLSPARPVGDTLAQPHGGDPLNLRIDQFYRINQRILTWAAIAGLIYILRDFFALIFLTFLLVTFTLPLIRKIERRLGLSRALVSTILYLIILVVLGTVVSTVVPALTREASQVATELTDIDQKMMRVRDSIISDYPGFEPIIDAYGSNEQIQDYMSELRDFAGPRLIATAQLALLCITNTLLALLFSYLIILDLPRLTREYHRFERSKLRDVFAESGQPVIQFGQVVARSFRAQAIIALTNTALTFVGFLVIGVPKVSLLTIVVFFTSFIPVLGVFLSTIPAILIGLNAGGYPMALQVILMVTIVHAIEAYVLNPIIYGNQLKINPVLVLVVLFVGHHFFGLWGMLLGVPVAYYILYIVLGVPLEDALEPPPPAEAPRMTTSSITPKLD